MVCCGGHDSREPKIAQHTGHHLADRPGRIGQFLLRYAGHEAAIRTLPSGGKIKQMSGDALAHRAERVDRGLL